MTAEVTRAQMWEARATDGRGAELAAWVRAEVLPALRGSAGLARTEVFTAPGDRVLLITWWTGEPVPVADPPAGLLARPVHRWGFTSEHVEEEPPAVGHATPRALLSGAPRATASR